MLSGKIRALACESHCHQSLNGLFRSDFLVCLHFPQFQGFGWTSLNARWGFLAKICFIKAPVALLHFSIRSELGAPKAHAFRHALQLMHLSLSTIKIPSSPRLLIAGQAFGHAGSAQCMHDTDADRFFTFG